MLGCDGSQEEVRARAVEVQRAEFIDTKSDPLIFIVFDNDKCGLPSLRTWNAETAAGGSPGGVAELLARVQGNGCSRISGCGSRASSAIGGTPVRSQKIQEQKNTSQEALVISAPFRRSFCLGLQALLAHLLILGQSHHEGG